MSGAAAAASAASSNHSASASSALVPAAASTALIEAAAPLRPKHKAVVLDEDEYVSTMEHIITRSFEDETPIHPAGGGVGSSAGGGSGQPGSSSSVAEGEAEQKARDKKDMTLGSFLSTHISEDNASFNALMVQAEEKRREKYWWIFENDKKAAQHLLETKDADKKLIATWGYTNRNALMFVPNPAEAVKQEYEKPTRLPEPGIDFSNTRFEGELFAARPKTPGTGDSHGTASGDSAVAPGATPAVGGFKFLRTPSPMPGVGGQSPFMTWGEVVGTPLHLHAEDDAPRASDLLSQAALAARWDDKPKPGPHFHVPETPSRDEMLYKLTHKNKLKEQKKTRERAVDSTPGRSPRQSPHVARAASSSSSAASSSSSAAAAASASSMPPGALSPAAQRLLGQVTKGSKRSASSDLAHQLRTSYHSPLVANGSGAKRQKTAASSSTPASLSIPTPATIRGPAPSAGRSMTSMTDGLL